MLDGFVLAPNGEPAPDVVVVSSAGGRAVTAANGSYRLELALPEKATSVQVTAVGSSGTNTLASASVALGGVTGSIHVDPLRLTSGSSCSSSWLPAFGGLPGTDALVYALTVFDDGSGPALYAGGDFTIAGGVIANHIARWDGSSWTALGSGMNESVRVLATFDEGSRPALYAGGLFTSAGGVAAKHIARWDGSSWAALGNGRPHPTQALVVFDDGSGPALHAGGGVGTTAGGVAKWDGSLWQPLQSQMDGAVQALAVFDDGGGPELYAGGLFTTAGGLAASRIARWSGSAWTTLGTGLSGSSAQVYSLTVFDDGGGPALYVGGRFDHAGGVAAKCLAKWSGSTWTALASDLTGSLPLVFSMTVFDDGGGPALYAAVFPSSGLGQLQKWNGSTWTTLGAVNSSLLTVTAFDDGGGPALFAGGGFDNTVGVAASRVAKWTGASWRALGSGLNSTVQALAAFDDGGGPALYAAGLFLTAGGVAASRIARWDGSHWTPLGSGLNSTVVALAVFDDGGGPRLYAGGTFWVAGSVGASRIARWNGSSWRDVGGGFNTSVFALTVFDDGGGQALYAGGQFTRTVGGLDTNHIAKWNGSSWSSLGSGLNQTVNALTVFDDGTGPALYAGGNFNRSGAVVLNGIAKWDGSSWTALATGLGATFTPTAWALTVFDDGSGSALHVGGLFQSAGGVAANNIAKWDGSSWAALAGGVDDPDSPLVDALAVFDDGTGPALYVGGLFTSAGGLAANHIARWNGSGWTALGSGMIQGVEDLLVFNDGSGPALFAGGAFASCPDSGDSFLARWGCLDTTSPILSCPASFVVLDGFADGPGEVVSFTVTASDELDPSPVVVCVPPSGSFFPAGTTTVTCTATDASGNASTCDFPLTVQPKAKRR